MTTVGDRWPGVDNLLAVARPRQFAEQPGRLVLICHHSVRSELAEVGLNEIGGAELDGQGGDYARVEFDVRTVIAAGYWRLTEDGEVVGDGYVDLRHASDQQIFTRDGGRCSRCGKRAESVNHRIRGNRTDRRPSNLHALCGDGTTGCHGWVTHNPAEAEARGWQVWHEREQRPTRAVPVWFEAGPLGRGYMILDDLLGINRWVEEETDDGET